MSRAGLPPEAEADEEPAEVRLHNGEIAQRRLSDIRESDANAKVHPVEQVERLAESIERFGFRDPIRIDENDEIIAGHGRLAAAKRLGLEEVPVIVLRGLSPEQIRALRINDNRLAEMSEWNAPLLRDELRSLRGGDFDLKAVGFSDEEFDSLLADDDGGVDPGPDESADEKAFVRPGEVWIAGRHRLICGDPADAKVVERTLDDDGIAPHLLVSDLGRAGIDDPRPVLAACGADVLYIWTTPLAFPALLPAIAETGFDFRTAIMWDKERMGGRARRYRLEHEVCSYAVRRGAKSRWVGDRMQNTAWRFEGDKPLSPPPDCYGKAMRNNSKRGDRVLDPWLGGGTGLIAAEMTGRKLVGIEASPARLDKALRRWERRTGKSATLDGGKETFAERRKAVREKRERAAKRKGAKK